MSAGVLGQPVALEVREVWYTNMHLLGFQPELCEEKFKLTFEKNMFVHINKKGSEVVLHFLFSKLDSRSAYEDFRDCWPVLDKKQEQQFRRTSSNLLTKIAKEEPQSKLPRMPASLLLSPGGDKFYIFLLRFSSYVLRDTCLNEAKSVEKNMFLSSHVTSGRGFGDLQSELPEVTRFAMKAHVVKHCNNIQKRAQLTTSMHKDWESYANGLVTEYRELTREGRHLTKKLLSLEDQQKQRTLTSTPQRFSTSGTQATNDRVLSLTTELMEKQRNSRIKKTREMWKILDKFMKSTDHQREVVNSILKGEANRYTINARKITFQIPELIVHEYEMLAREGKASNTYQAGKLNLICLIQMWKCSLRILRTQILKDGVPSFEKESRYVNEELQNHRAHIAATFNLKASLSSLKVSLEESIRQLELELEEHRNTSLPVQEEGGRINSSLPHLVIPEITIPSLGLDLVPPSPPKTDIPHIPSPAETDKVSRQFSSLAHDVSTPDAVRNISLSIHQASFRSIHQPLPSQIPVATRIAAAPVPAAGPHKEALTPHSKGVTGHPVIPHFSNAAMPHSKGDTSHSATPKSSVTTPLLKDPSNSATSHMKGVVSHSAMPQSSETTPLSRNSAMSHVKGVVSHSANPQSSESTPLSSNSATSHLKGVISHLATPHQKGITSSMATPHRRGITSSVATPHLKSHDNSMRLKNMPRAHEILADQIAAAVSTVSESGSNESFQLEDTPPNQLHSVVDTVSAMGRDAFTSRDMIARTPMSQKTNPVHSTKHFTKENTAALSLVLSKGEKEEEEEKEKVEEEKEEEEEEEEKEEEVEEEGGKKKKKEEYLSQTPLQNSFVSGQEVIFEEPGPLFTSATPQLTTHAVNSMLSSNFSTENVAQAHHEGTLLPTPLKPQGIYITPAHRSMSFLKDIQPPTPFQFAEFDLDSSTDAKDGGISGSHTQDSSLLTQTDVSVGGSSGEERHSVDHLNSISLENKMISHGNKSAGKITNLLDFSTPGTDKKTASPLMTSTVYQKEQQCQGESGGISIPAYLYPTSGSVKSRPSTTYSNPWLAAMNSKSNEGFGIFGDTGSPELVSVSGSDSPEPD